VGVLTSNYAGILTMVVMLVIGSTIRLADLVGILRHPRALLVGLAGQMVLVPVLGLGLALMLGGTSCLALAIVAVVPGGGTSTILTAAARGDTALSALLTLCSNLLVALWVPVLLFAAATVCGAAAVAEDLDYVALTLRLALVSALPLLLGMVAASLFPRVMGRIQPQLANLAMVVFLGFVAWILWDDRANLASYVSGAGLLVPILMVLCGAAAWFVASLLRFGTATRKALMFEWSVQNIPLAIMGALSLGAGQAMAVPAASYGLQQLMLGLIAVLVLRRVARPAVS